MLIPASVHIAGARRANPVPLSRPTDPHEPSRQILNHLLADTPNGRMPHIGQRGSLIRSITACLTDLRWRRDDLEVVLAGWDTDPIAPAYPLLLGRLLSKAPGLGFCCPECRIFTDPEVSDPRTGYCLFCRTITAFPVYPTTPSSSIDPKDTTR